MTTPPQHHPDTDLDEQELREIAQAAVDRGITADRDRLAIYFELFQDRAPSGWELKQLVGRVDWLVNDW